jgi:hypothetical protein
MNTATQDAFEMMNQTMRWNPDSTLDWKAETVYAIYENNAIIGWCLTPQEADEICDKLPLLQWGNKKKTKIPEECPQLVASVMFTDADSKK